MDNQAFRARLAAAVVTTSGQIKICIDIFWYIKSEYIWWSYPNKCQIKTKVEYRVTEGEQMNLPTMISLSPCHTKGMYGN